MVRLNRPFEKSSVAPGALCGSFQRHVGADFVSWYDLQAPTPQPEPEQLDPTPPPGAASQPEAAAAEAGADGEGSEAEGSAQSYEDRVRAIYAQHAPERLENIPGLMERYQGREQQLVDKLVAKYCPEPPDEAELERARLKQQELDKVAKRIMLKYALFRQQAPDRWRFASFSDERKNDAYTTAIEAAVAPGSTVLDVGVGSGLLAMMAARAGAQAVTLEASKPASAVVAKIAAANGLADKLSAVWAACDSVVCKETAAAGEEPQLQERASVVCHEVVEPGLLCEKLADFVWLGQNKAVSTEQVQMLPASAQVWVMPIFCPIQPQSLEMTLGRSMSGLDLSEFDKFRRHKLQPVSLKDVKWTQLAQPQLLAQFDFSEQLVSSAATRMSFGSSEGCSWNGIALWQELQLDEHTRVSSRPSEHSTALQAVVFLPETIRVPPGGAIEFSASHNTKSWQFEWPVPVPVFPEIESSEVLRWHWAMLMDRHRNEPYDRAITKAVAKAEFVLDIGSGTGLLSMFAARAGAKHITTVEGSAQMGDCAARCIAANGLGDAIHPLQMMSTQIVVGEHMAQRAELCISEIVDCGLLGEWCLPTMHHAREHLLTPEAQCIPCSSTVHGFLLSMPRQPYSVSRPLESEAGFDMREYNTYAYAPHEYEQCRVSDLEFTRMSEQFDAWEFDLTGRTRYPEEAKVLSITATEAGQVDAVCFYFTLNLDEEICISTAPWVENCWTQSITFFEQPLQVRPGDTIELGTYHKVKKIAWAQPRVIPAQ